MGLLWERVQKSGVVTETILLQGLMEHFLTLLEYGSKPYQLIQESVE